MDIFGNKEEITKAGHSGSDKTNKTVAEFDTLLTDGSTSESGSKGKMYEIYLFMHILTKGSKMNFDLGKEVKMGHKFDDIVISYDNSTKYIFCQAKHVDNELKEIDTEVLLGRKQISLSKNDFNMKKYFISYLRIKNQLNHQDKELSRLFIFSNVSKINLQIVTEVNELNKHDNLLRVEGKSKLYKLNVKEKDEIFTELQKTENDITTLAKELFKCINEKFVLTTDSDCLNYYHNSLIKEKVIKKIKISKQGQFHKEFKSGINLGLQAKNIREALIKENHLKQLGDKKFNNRKWSIFDDFDKTNDITLPEENNEDFTELIKELSRVTKDPKTIIMNLGGNCYLRKYYTALKNENIIEETDLQDISYIGMFHQNFINIETMTAGAALLREKLEELKIDLKTHWKISNVFGTNTEKDTIVLPTYKIEDEDIKSFFQCLLISINQPNVTHFPQGIQKEVISLQNTISPKYFVNEIEEFIKTWKNKDKQKECWILNEDKNEFIKIISDENSQLVANVVARDKTETYLKEIERKITDFNLRYKTGINGLENFLNSDCSDEICLILTKQTLLSCIKLVAHMIPEKRHEYIFISVKGLKENEATKAVDAFYSGQFQFLFIECDMDKNAKYIIEVIENRLLKNESQLLKTVAKKIVFITTDENYITKLHKYIKIEDEAIKFGDLKNGLEILEQKILFQGCEVPLYEIIGEIGEILDTDTLARIVHKPRVKIGIELKNLGEIEDYYIDRDFISKVEIKGDIFKDETIKDLFAISSINEDFVKDLKVKIVFLKSENEEEHFKRLQTKYSNCNIHWLKSEQGKFIWQKSHGSISALIKYKTLNSLGCKENIENVSQQNLVIIADVAGMGKSTVLTKIAKNIKENNPNIFVVKIDINNYTDFLKERKSIDEIVQFLSDLLQSQTDTKLKNEFEKELFRNCFKTKQIAILLDGFDEIIPDYEDLITDLLQKLRDLKVKKLFVTSRLNVSVRLEKVLNVFSYILKPFSPKNQEDFLKKFWKKTLNFSNEKQLERLEIYAKEVTEKFSELINDNQHEFTGIPLQLKMLGEIFKSSSQCGTFEGCEEFVKHSNEPKPTIEKKFNIIDLYENFVKTKFYDIHYKEKKSFDSSKTLVDTFLNREYNNFLADHQKIALYFLFKNNHLKDLYPQDINEIIKVRNEENVGIVGGIVDEKPHFVHRTFAEYFAALYFNNQIQTESMDVFKLFAIVLEKLEYKVIRSFLNILLKDSLDTVNLNNKNFIEIIKSSTILKTAVSEVNKQIIILIFKILKDKHTIMEFINCYENNGILHSSAENGNKEIVEILLKNGAKINAKGFGKQTALLFAANKGHKETVEILVEKGADLEAEGINKWRALHLAALYGWKKIVEILLEKGADIEAKDKDKWTALHLAVRYGQKEIVEILLKKGADFEAEDINKWRALHLSARYGYKEIVNILLEKGAYFEAEDNKKWRALHYAVENGHKEIVGILLEKGADFEAEDEDKRTALHFATQNGNMEIVEILLEKRLSANVNAKNCSTNSQQDKCNKSGFSLRNF